jgi:hypothetical protein
MEISTISIDFFYRNCNLPHSLSWIYRVIQEELPPLTELIADDISSKNVI